MRLSLIQCAYDEGQTFEARIDHAMDLVLATRGSDLVVLPELWAYGAFTPEHWSERAQPVDGEIARRAAAAAKELGAIVHAGSIVERGRSGADFGARGRGLWNTSLVFGPEGQSLATYRKIHPFGFGEGEAELLEAGSFAKSVPTGSFTMGLATCYDLRFPELFRLLVADGVDLFVIPAAWPAERAKHWRLLGRARALENQAFVAQCNMVGVNGGLVLGGHSQVVNPEGDVMVSAGSGEEILTVDIDIAEAVRFRQSFPVLTDRRLSNP